MKYYAFHIGDYVSATRHLSWDEDLAYRRLLDIYYASEKPFPADVKQVSRLILAHTDSQREAVKTVLEEFFELTDAGWVNRRADAEIEVMQAKQDKQRQKAHKRWSTAAAVPQHAEQHAAASKSDADALPPIPIPIPIPITPISPSRKRPGTVHEFPPGFEAFWSAYPRKLAKAQAARAFARLKPDESLLARILASLQAQAAGEAWQRDGGRFVPHAATWLNGRRWEDELSLAKPVNDVFAGAL